MRDLIRRSEELKKQKRILMAIRECAQSQNTDQLRAIVQNLTRKPSRANRAAAVPIFAAWAMCNQSEVEDMKDDSASPISQISWGEPEKLLPFDRLLQDCFSFFMSQSLDDETKTEFAMVLIDINSSFLRLARSSQLTKVDGPVRETVMTNMCALVENLSLLDAFVQLATEIELVFRLPLQDIHKHVEYAFGDLRTALPADSEIALHLKKDMPPSNSKGEVWDFLTKIIRPDALFLAVFCNMVCQFTSNVKAFIGFGCFVLPLQQREFDSIPKTKRARMPIIDIRFGTLIMRSRGIKMHTDDATTLILAWFNEIKNKFEKKLSLTDFDVDACLEHFLPDSSALQVVFEEGPEV